MSSLAGTRQGRNLIWKARKRGLPAEWRPRPLACGHVVEAANPDVVVRGRGRFFCPNGCGLQEAA